jgi:hypothetical protein
LGLPLGDGNEAELTYSQLFGLICYASVLRASEGANSAMATDSRRQLYFWFWRILFEQLELLIEQDVRYLVVARGIVLPRLLSESDVGELHRLNADVLSHLGSEVNIVDVKPLFDNLMSRIRRLRELQRASAGERDGLE